MPKPSVRAFIPCFLLMLAVLLTGRSSALPAAAQAAASVASLPRIAAVPAELASRHFIVTVGAAHSPVFHAVAGYYLLNFEITGPTRITVTADDPHYWDRGVEVQPMRLGIRPQRNGATISFTVDGPTKLSITRPGDFFFNSEMLFLFANHPPGEMITAQTPGVRYYGPGVYHENIDAHSGDHIYIAAGAVIYGSLNVWDVHDVTVSGLGTLIYSGPQDPDTDQGWIHKRNWHVIVMDKARDIHIEGITGIVRSRTWMVQMKDSHGIVFRNIKIIGGSPGNANQDGMDWLGGGDTLVDDSFFRAADDVFAMQGNWDGYTEKAMLTPGHLVSNIVVQNSVLSTSISNIVRLGWPRKSFESHGFTMRNSDVIQMGVGGCGTPFALFEIWANPGGKGEHSDIHFDDIRLDNWYSLVQLEEPNPGVQHVDFNRIAAMDGMAIVPSTLLGDVSGVSFHDVNVSGTEQVTSDAGIPLDVLDGAAEPQYSNGGEAGFRYSGGMIRPNRRVKFTAPRVTGVQYSWSYGDGSFATGRVVRHAFPDDAGTLLDGSGRFRVLLSATDAQGHVTWSSESVVVSRDVHKSVKLHMPLPGLGPVQPPDLRTPNSLDGRKLSSEVQSKAAAAAFRRNVAGYLRVPVKGGYTFTLFTSTTASLSVDGVRATSREQYAQVCGSEGNAVQAIQVSVVLERGYHQIEIRRGAGLENAASVGGAPVIAWEGPNIGRALVPASNLFHRSNADQNASSKR